MMGNKTVKNLEDDSDSDDDDSSSNDADIKCLHRLIAEKARNPDAQQARLIHIYVYELPAGMHSCTVLNNIPKPYHAAYHPNGLKGIYALQWRKQGEPEPEKIYGDPMRLIPLSEAKRAVELEIEQERKQRKAQRAQQ